MLNAFVIKYVYSIVNNCFYFLQIFSFLWYLMTMENEILIDNSAATTTIKPKANNCVLFDNVDIKKSKVSNSLVNGENIKSLIKSELKLIFIDEIVCDEE